MFENLQEKLEGAFQTFKGDNKITEINIATSLKEIRRALVDADVNFKIAKEFTAKVKEQAFLMKEALLKSDLLTLCRGETSPHIF